MSTLEERVQRLEDIEEIRRLKHRYAQAIDAPFDMKILESVFTPDAVVEGGPAGTVSGWDAIQEFYENVRTEQTFTLHLLCGSVVDIDPSGTEAAGRWFLWEPATFKAQAYWSAIVYDDKYRKLDCDWKIAKTKLSHVFRTSYEKGWVEEPWFELR